MKMKTKSDYIFDVINYIIMGLVFILALYPIYFVLIASFSDPAYVNSGQTIFLPKGLTLDGYRKAFAYKQIWTGYKNSAIYTVVGTSISLSLLIPASFALSRKELVGRKFFTAFFLFTMYFSGGTVPLYLLVKNLGLFNTMWSLVLPTAFSVYNMIICRSFFISNVSEELYESVKIDGGGYLKFFFAIVIPLSKAIIAVMVLYHALGYWNTYLSALYYLRDNEKFPLQLVLKNLTDSLSLMQAEGAEAAGVAKAERLKDMLRYSTILIVALPMIILYPFVQKYFVTGVMIGSVKG